MTTPAVDSMTDSPAAGETPVARVVSDEFRRLFEEHASYAWNTLRRFGVREEDRDDLVQEIFVTVHSLLEDYDRARPFRPWLFGITYRIALRDRRRKGRNREGVTTEGDVEKRDSSPNAEVTMVQEERAVLVHAAIQEIEVHRRAVFIMKEIDDVEVPAIAEALAIPLNTAYSRLRLAREDFRQAVTRLRAARPVKT